MIPPDLAAFEAYNARMHRELTVSAPAREMAAFLFRSPAPGLGPLARAYRGLTAELLPPPIRRAFGLDDAVGTAGARRLAGAAARLERWLPPTLRHLPAYRAAQARLAGREPGPITRLLARALVGR
jgi:uncharacterized protein (DUF2236 family)